MRIFETIRGPATLWAKDLRKAREAKGVSLRSVAKSAGISPALLSRIELRQVRVNPEIAKKIESALNT